MQNLLELAQAQAQAQTKELFRCLFTNDQRYSFEQGNIMLSDTQMARLFINSEEYTARTQFLNEVYFYPL